MLPRCRSGGGGRQHVPQQQTNELAGHGERTRLPHGNPLLMSLVNLLHMKESGSRNSYRDGGFCLKLSEVQVTRRSPLKTMNTSAMSKTAT